MYTIQVEGKIYFYDDYSMFTVLWSRAYVHPVLAFGTKASSSLGHLSIFSRQYWRNFFASERPQYEVESHDELRENSKNFHSNWPILDSVFFSGFSIELGQLLCLVERAQIGVATSFLVGYLNWMPKITGTYLLYTLTVLANAHRARFWCTH